MDAFCVYCLLDCFWLMSVPRTNEFNNNLNRSGEQTENKTKQIKKNVLAKNKTKQTKKKTTHKQRKNLNERIQGKNEEIY